MPARDPAELKALAAAHRLTGRVAETWSPWLVRSPRVLVPVQLDALVVRHKRGTWADCRLRRPAGGGSQPVPPPPFTDREPREPGVYLHVALPDALTRELPARPGGNGERAFPAIPDRWLVVRLAVGLAGPQRDLTGWVLEAGGDEPRVTPLGQWAEPGGPAPGAQQPLTALGDGDPAWAAYYDNVAGRLGLHDPLGPDVKGPLAYLMCGWYSNPALDPLGDPALSSAAAFEARMRELRWNLSPAELQWAAQQASAHVVAAREVGLQVAGMDAVEFDPNRLPAEDPDAGGVRLFPTREAWWPRAILCHGSAVGIDWPQEGGLASGLGGAPAASAIRVAVGTTLADALGATVAAADGSAEEARVLEALQLGILNEIEQVDGRARIDALLHASAFGARAGGTTTERVRQPAAAAPPALPTDPVVPGPGVFARPGGEGRPAAAGREARLPVGAVPDLSGSATTVSFEAKETGAFASVSTDSMSTLVAKLKAAGLQAGQAGARTAGAATPAGEEAPLLEVRRSLPRFFHPSDPVLLVQGAARTFKHGGDGWYSEDGSLPCRLTGFTVTELHARSRAGDRARVGVRGADLLGQGVENGSTPPECEDLVRELALLDPGSAGAAAAVALPEATGELLAVQTRDFAVEQTAWWITRDPRVESGPLLARSGIAGMLPSPIAVSPPEEPWLPRHLDWEAEYLPSERGRGDWALDEVDFAPLPERLPAADASGLVVRGRSLLTGGVAATAAAAARAALAAAAAAGGAADLEGDFTERFASPTAELLLTELQSGSEQALRTTAGGQPDLLDDIATALERMDVLSGVLDGFHAAIRAGGSEATPAGLRAGMLRLRRLRLVDAFGRAVDLLGSGPTAPVDPARLLRSSAVAVPDRADLVALQPRFTAPARLTLRWQDAADGSGGADADGNGANPVCGFLLPDHLDGALEFFDAAGESLGQLREAVAGLVWEDAPGRPSLVGQTPGRAIPNPCLARLGDGLLAWGLVDAAGGGQEPVLSSLLRTIDSTLWSVDPFGHVGEEHHSLLVGHPIVVMRAWVLLEVEDPDGLAPPDALPAVPLRLGALAHWQDGLLGYFAGDDFGTLHCIDPAAARWARELGPNRGFLQQATAVGGYAAGFADDVRADDPAASVEHPYIDTGGVTWVRPGQELPLTLLVVPHGQVHASSGVLPRKEIGMRREWVAAALARLAPSFRFGPVLIDPATIRMPVPSELNGTWSWDHRADAATWSEQPVTNATPEALLPDTPAVAQEGWLQLHPPGETGGPGGQG
jgi:hypothetical protein